MPPVALTCLKYAVAPQLSVSPIWAYGPARARSPQAVIGDFAADPAAPAPDGELELQAARVPASSAAARGKVVRLRSMVLNLLEAHEERIHAGGSSEVL